jgi:imidazolonepropionase
MSRRVLVRGARQLLTLRGPSGPRRGAALKELGIIIGGAVLIEDGLITHVGPASRIENLAEAREAEEIDADGRVVMPGFVDSHTHLAFAAPRLSDYEMRLEGRGYQEIAAAGGGILSSVRSLRAASVHTLERMVRQAVVALASHGTTTVEAKSGYGLDEPSEVKTLRAIGRWDGRPLDILATCLGAHAVPPEYAGRADDYIEWLAETLLPLVARRKLARFADVYCDANAFSVGQARRYLETGKRLGLLPRIHASQFAELGAVDLALELGCLSADHLEAIGPAQVEALAKGQTIATLLPGSVFHLGLDRYAPARALVDAGAPVALATDYNPGSSPTYNMQMVLSLACLEMKMTPAEAIAAATINGAHALRVAQRAGSLEFGKQGDLLVMGVGDYREIPYYFGVNHVQRVLKRGVTVYRRSEVQCPAD